MKKLLLIPIALFIAVSANAQEAQKVNRGTMQKSFEQRTPEQRAEMRTKRMTEELSLTKEQQVKIHQLSLEQAKNQADHAKRSKIDAERTKMERVKNQQEIKNVLTAEQQQKWTELQSKQSKSRKNNMKSKQNDFKRKGRMIKKADSTQARRPGKKMIPATKVTPAVEAPVK